jgi:hypothetical protein
MNVDKIVCLMARDKNLLALRSLQNSIMKTKCKHEPEPLEMKLDAKHEMQRNYVSAIWTKM